MPDDDLTAWAERRAPTLDIAGWLDAERDAYADTDSAERFDPQYARALLAHLRTVALDVLTPTQAEVLAMCCEQPGSWSPLRPPPAVTLAELLTMGLISSAPIQATAFGVEVVRVRRESGVQP